MLVVPDSQEDWDVRQEEQYIQSKKEDTVRTWCWWSFKGARGAACDVLEGSGTGTPGGGVGLAPVLGLAFVTQGMATVVVQLTVPAANRQHAKVSVRQCLQAEFAKVQKARVEADARLRACKQDQKRGLATAERWKHLRKSVKSAIRKQAIQPPEDGRDDFLVLDEVYGPSIYTVNEQYIKPITRFHGKMSWALMRNPAGLECDMFISHAWLEGIFEFLRKVLHSWPRGVRTAWCCMLANPQNLNIEAFLQSPSKSPFALALRASEVVLVVPNRHVSVYTRLWCAYEAYIADQEGKTILIAKTSNLHGIIFAMLPMAAAALIGATLGSCARHYKWHCARQVTYVGGVASVAAYNVDRVNAERTVLEAEQLRKGYRGSIHYADCTQPEDAQRIRQEIGRESDVVDYAIDVLLSAGMSTPALRDIAREGVDIQRTAYSGVASSVVLLFPVDFITFTFAVVETIYLRGNFLRILLSSTCILERLILATLIYRIHPTRSVRASGTVPTRSAPLGFFVNNTVLALLTECGMPVVAYYYYNALCLPFAMYIFHLHRPQEVKAAKGKGCEVFMNSMYHAMDWLPYMLVWFVAKFIGNFVLEDGFPLLFNTFNTEKVPIIGPPDSTEHLIPFTLYTALLWFPAMAAGDTISRRVPQFLDVTVNWKCYTYLAISIVMCVVGEALDFLLLALVTVVAAFIANFGNGFIYGLSAKFIDWKIAEEHRYTAYNFKFMLWSSVVLCRRLGRLCWTGCAVSVVGRSGVQWKTLCLRVPSEEIAADLRNVTVVLRAPRVKLMLIAETRAIFIDCRKMWRSGSDVDMGFSENRVPL
eukprot:s2161_g11.t1